MDSTDIVGKCQAQGKTAWNEKQPAALCLALLLKMERARRGTPLRRTLAAPRFLFLPDAGGAPVPPILRAGGVRLRHLKTCLCRVPQTATGVAVGGHKLEAIRLWWGSRLDFGAASKIPGSGGEPG